MRSETDWPPEVAGVLDLLESQPPEAAMLVGCFLAAVAHPDHAAELAMFDKLPSAARMAVGRHDLDMGETCVFRKLGHIGRAFGHVAIFRRDRGQGDPVAQPLDRRLLARLGRLADRRHRAACSQRRQYKITHFGTSPHGKY